MRESFHVPERFVPGEAREVRRMRLERASAIAHPTALSLSHHRWQSPAVRPRQTFRDLEADKFYLVEEGKDQLVLQHLSGRQP
jgi:hypothetical protein